MVLAIPHVRFIYQLPSARVAVDTTVVLGGTFVALVAAARYQRHRRLGDLAVVAAMVLFAAAEPIFGGLASVFARHDGARLTPQVARLLAAGALAAAATLPLVRGPSAPRRWARTGPVVIAVAVAAMVAVLLWRTTPKSLEPAASNTPRILGDPLVAVIALAGAGLFVVAIMAFAAGDRPRNDPFLGWLSTGCAFNAIASLNYALFPPTSLRLLHLGDVMRIAAVVAWTVGGCLELKSHWDAHAARARVEERRALARDLHDGLAQELAFIASQSGSVRNGADPEWRAEVADAARRALVESRRVVSTLAAGPADEAVADLAQSAASVALRHGVELSLDVDGGRRLGPAERDALVQIVREAVGNAARHGGASRIHVELAAGRLFRVSDDGVGFDAVARPLPTNFGLTSMRERAEAIGATFDVRSAPGQGTVVEVLWPSVSATGITRWRSNRR
jgi:signal transduction histidine kinase